MEQFLLDAAAQAVAGVMVALFTYWLNCTAKDSALTSPYDRLQGRDYPLPSIHIIVFKAAPKAPW